METAPIYETPRGQPLDWLEPFEWEDPPEWEEAPDIAGLAWEMLADGRIEAATWLLYNREKAMQLHDWRESLHTVPSAEHYRNTYMWDSGFCAVMFAQAAEFALEAAGYLETIISRCQTPEDLASVQGAINELRKSGKEFLRAAVTESFWVVNGQKEDGFIPNLQYAKGWPRWFDIEWWFSVDKTNRSSNYTQPPVLALSTMATYKALIKADPESARHFAGDMMPYLDKLFGYLDKRRNSPDDPLRWVADPHETGMDSSVQWDYNKPLRPEDKGPEHDAKELFETRIIDGAYAVLRQAEMWSVGGDPDKMRELFCANDVSFNAICFHNLQVMSWLSAELGKSEQAENYRLQAKELQQAMLSKMDVIDEVKVRQPGFYSLDAAGEPIDKITIGNLFVLLLPGLRIKQLENVLDMLDEHFDVPYPLPSCSIKDAAADPHNIEKERLWRGPTWQNTNWYLVEFGLKMQAGRPGVPPRLRQRCLVWADRIIDSSNELLDRNHQTDVSAKRALGGLVMTRQLKGRRADRYVKYITGAREHYDPYTGEGQRERVVNFSWSWLPRFMRRTHRQNKEAAVAAPLESGI